MENIISNIHDWYIDEWWGFHNQSSSIHLMKNFNLKFSKSRAVMTTYTVLCIKIWQTGITFSVNGCRGRVMIHPLTLTSIAHYSLSPSRLETISTVNVTASRKKNYWPYILKVLGRYLHSVECQSYTYTTSSATFLIDSKLFNVLIQVLTICKTEIF